MPIEEWLKFIFGYLVPLALAALLGFLGKFLGFVFFEFLNKKRITFLVLLFLVSFYIAPYNAGWLTFGGFLFLVGFSLIKFYLGPKNGNHIVFAGFYDNSSEKGFFSKNGTVRFLDAKFFDRFHELIQRSKTNEFTGISAVNFRIPSLIHSWCDYDRFRKLTNRYAAKGLGVVWGTTDKEGNLQHLESRLHTEIYFGKARAQEHIDAAVQVLKNSAITTEEKASFLAQTLAAYWINSFNNALIQTHGWNDALQVTKEAQLLFEKALNTFEKQTAGDPTKVLAYARRMMLPNFYVEEARTRLHGEQWEEAIDHLVRTLFLNPFYPYDSSQEFLGYYTANYHRTITVEAPLKDEVIDAEMIALEGKIMPLSPPHLQLLLNWFNGYGRELRDINTKIEESFSALESEFPDNPFIFLYWSDAVRVPPRLGLESHGERVISLKPEGVGLPIRTLELAIKKCEKAYTLAPNMHLISSRIAGMCLPLALSYDERSLEHKKWMKKFGDYSEKAKIHMNDMSGSWKKGDDIYDWKKYGLKKDEDGKLVVDETVIGEIDECG